MQEYFEICSLIKYYLEFKFIFILFFISFENALIQFGLGFVCVCPHSYPSKKPQNNAKKKSKKQKTPTKQQPKNPQTPQKTPTIQKTQPKIMKSQLPQKTPKPEQGKNKQTNHKKHPN